MHRYNPMAQYPVTSAIAGQDSPGVHDREGSASGSETASSYAHYMPDARDEFDLPDDPHLALTSQTLNADGTPKRPMNAFMIFARKRRPQISAANQMMRTGDISKILSKEWNTMEMADKKFYLDQAKKLKDNFNSKYPDYVYRRRPNNSRRKKKPDSEHSPTEPSHAGDLDDTEDTSPLEEDYPIVDSSNSGYSYARSQTSGVHSTYESADTFLGSPNSPYSYSPDFHTGQFGQPSSRIAGMTSPVESSLSTSSTPLRIPPLPSPSFQLPSTSLVQPSAMSTAAASQNTHNFWEANRTLARPDQGRSSTSWPVLPALDTSISRQRSSDISAISSLSSRSDAFSPQVPHRPWSSAASSTASSSSGGASGSHYSNSHSPFPTLSSPFFPSHSPPRTGGELASSPTAHPSGAQDYFHSSQQPRRMSTSGRMSGSQEHGGFGQSQGLSQSPNSAYLSPSNNSGWASQYGRTSSTQHRHPPPISTYALQQPSTNSASPSSSTSGPPSSQLAYPGWDRKYDGR